MVRLPKSNGPDPQQVQIHYCCFEIDINSASLHRLRIWFYDSLISINSHKNTCKNQSIIKDECPIFSPSTVDVTEKGWMIYSLWIWQSIILSNNRWVKSFIFMAVDCHSKDPQWISAQAKKICRSLQGLAFTVYLDLVKIVSGEICQDIFLSSYRSLSKHL